MIMSSSRKLLIQWQCHQNIMRLLMDRSKENPFSFSLQCSKVQASNSSTVIQSKAFTHEIQRQKLLVQSTAPPQKHLTTTEKTTEKTTTES